MRRFAANPRDAAAADDPGGGTGRSRRDADDVHSDAPPGRPCRQRAPAVGDRHDQLPDLPGREGGRRQGAAPEAGGPRRHRHHDRASPQASDASPLRPDVLAAVTKAVHARHPGVPVSPYQESGGTDGRLLPRGRHPDLRRRRDVHQGERHLHPRPERAAPGQVVLRRPRALVRPHPGGRRPALKSSGVFPFGSESRA